MYQSRYIHRYLVNCTIHTYVRRYTYICTYVHTIHWEFTLWVQMQAGSLEGAADQCALPYVVRWHGHTGLTGILHHLEEGLQGVLDQSAQRILRNIRSYIQYVLNVCMYVCTECTYV